MRAGTWTRGTTLIGAGCLIASTFLTWNVGELGGRPRRVYIYQPGPLPGHDLWHASPVIAVLVIVCGVAAAGPLLGGVRSTRAFALESVAAVVAFSAAIVCLFSPPGHDDPAQVGGRRPGPILAAGGAVLLILAVNATFLTPRARLSRPSAQPD